MHIPVGCCLKVPHWLVVLDPIGAGAGIPGGGVGAPRSWSL
jgi:hypothetical protein